MTEQLNLVQGGCLLCDTGLEFTKMREKVSQALNVLKDIEQTETVVEMETYFEGVQEAIGLLEGADILWYMWNKQNTSQQGN